MSCLPASAKAFRGLLAPCLPSIFEEETKARPEHFEGPSSAGLHLLDEHLAKVSEPIEAKQADPTILRRAQTDLSTTSSAARRRFASVRRFTAHDSFGDGLVFDEVMAECWPALRKFMEDFVLIGIVEPTLKRLVGSWVHFEACFLGDVPPHILGAKSTRVNGKSGNAAIGESERTVEIAMDISLDAQEIDVSLHLGPSLQLSVTRVKISGTICLELRDFVSELPLLSGMGLYFMNPPEVSISFAGLGGLARRLEERLTFAQKIIEKQLANQLVVPNRMAVHVSRAVSYYSLRHPRPDGLLDLHISGVSELHSFGAASSGILCCRRRRFHNLRLELRLGAQTWSSPDATPEGSDAANWNTSCSFFVDKKHGQSMIVELMNMANLLGFRDVVLGDVKMSVDQLVEDEDGESTWEISKKDELCVSEDEVKPILALNATFHPLYRGRNVEEAKNMHKLRDGTCGVLVIIIDCVRDLDLASDGKYAECVFKLGDVEMPTLRVVAAKKVADDVGPATEKLKFLLSKDYSAGDAAWMLDMDEGEVSAIKRGTIAATFRQELRLRLRDPMQETLTLELRVGPHRPVPVARNNFLVRDLLHRERWQLPMAERRFGEVLRPGMFFQGGSVGLPSFVLSLQVLGAAATRGK